MIKNHLIADTFPIVNETINVVNNLVYSQSYSLITNSLKDQLNEMLGHRRASMWLDLYRISHSGKLAIKETYCYLAKLWKCCRRTAIRNIKAFEEYRFIIKQTHKIKFNLNATNEYRVCTPQELLSIVNNFTKRKQTIHSFDYSIQHELIEDEQNQLKQEPKINNVETKEASKISKPNDTRNLLDLETVKVGGSMGALLNRIKNNIKGKKIEDIKQIKTETFHVYEGGGGDSSVTDQELYFKKDNKSAPNARAMNFVNQNGGDQASEPEPTPIEIPDWIKRKLWEFVKDEYFISDKDKVFREAIGFIKTNVGYTPHHSLNVFKKRIKENKWSTPIAMRYGNNDIWDK
jgi:hypothetical protein